MKIITKLKLYFICLKRLLIVIYHAIDYRLAYLIFYIKNIGGDNNETKS